MRCKHCGKKLEYDTNAEYVVYNNDIYCSDVCMLFDVDFGIPNIELYGEDDFNKSVIWFVENDHPKMSMKDAMKILIRHNKWRRDNHTPNKYEPVDPTELGIAIEVAIDTLDCMIQNVCEPYDI